MKKVVAFIVILCLSVSCLTTYAEDAVQEEKQISFNDVTEGDSAYDAVMYLAEKGIINGKGNSLFCPNDGLKREELAKILTNAFGLTLSENAPVFNDVPAGMWYADFARAVAKGGLMTGISQNEFGVGQNLSRQDLAVILKRFLEKKNVDLTYENSVMYADLSQIADYAKDAVSVVSGLGIMEERENNCFAPTKNATRAETAIAIYNSIKIQEEQARALGRFGDNTQYMGPFDLPDDRLQEAMPPLFDVANMEGALVHYENFEDDDYGEFKMQFQSAAVTFEEGKGIDGSTCLAIEGSPDEIYHPRLHLAYKPGEIMAGDYYIFSVMIKAEEITGTGNFRGILTVTDHNGKWLTESGAPSAKSSMDWTKFEYVVMVPFGAANTYSAPEFYQLTMGLYKNKLGGKVYFDNMTLKKAKFDPMNTVLMTPNYKGIITEENGIGDISLRAYVDHLNMWDLSKMKFTAQITDDDHNVLMKTENENVTPVMDVYFSSRELEIGKDYYLESILTDKETGDFIQKSEWPLHKKEPDYVTKIGFDEYGRVTSNGVPFIPKSIYNWQDPQAIQDDLIDQESINVIQIGDYGSTANFGTSEIAQKNETDLHARGKYWDAQFRMFAQRNNASQWTTNYVANWADTRGALGRVAENFRKSPNLFGYYAWDEQDPIQHGEELAWVRKIGEYYDPDHPTLCAIDKLNSHRPGIYAKMSDFLGFDPYPASGSQASLSLVSDYMETGKKMNPNRPVYTILQGFWFHTRGDSRGPTPQEFKNMAFQALIAGACMLDCYAWSDAKSKPSPGMTAEDMLAMVTDTYDEIQYLEPIILSAEPAPYYEVNGGGNWLKHMTKRYDGKSYLFAVNADGNDGTATVYLDGVTEIRSMYTKQVYEADDTGWFTIEMSSYGVDVFEYEQADYKSSHAELTRFGLDEIVTVDSESETPAFIVGADLNEVTYNAKISDYATLFINENLVENTGTLNISGLDEIVVKVVSEDERFVTEKTYKINRD